MFAIGLREFTRSFKSIRSVSIIAIIFSITIVSARFMSFAQGQVEELSQVNNIYAGGLVVLLLIVGPLFVTSLSHNVLNKEIESRTIRFIVTKTPRRNVIIGKFMGMIMFWIVCLSIAFLLLIPYAKAFYFPEFMQSIVFMAYFAGFTLFLSTVINNSSMTMFIGILLSIAFPVIGLWSIGTENVFIKAISYVTPYFYYGQENTICTYSVALFPVLFVLLSLFILKKRDV